MRFRCPNCQSLFELVSLPASGRTECPSCFKPVKVGTAPKAPSPSRPVASRPVAPDPDFASIPQLTFQPQTLPAYLSQPPPQPQRRPQNPWDQPPKKRSKNSSGNVLLWIAVAWIAGVLTLGVLGTIGFVVYRSGVLVGTAEMSIAGFSAKAPGKIAERNANMSSNEVGILNPRTGSQFQLIHVRSEGFRTVDPNAFIQGLKMRSGSMESKPVTRLGLAGFHFTAENSFNSADAEGEVFPISDGVLIALYQPGSSLAAMKGRDVKHTGQKERELDRVEDFFASLKRK